MKSNIAFGIVLLLAGCGNLGTESDALLNRDFGAEVTYFVREGEARGIPDVRKLANVAIEFAKLDIGTMGRCERDFFNGRKILIDAARWETLDNWERKSLILHEMGHCALNQEHRPGSLMNAGRNMGAELQANEKQYLDELFFH